MGLLPLPRWGWRDRGVRRVMTLMLPAMFGSSVAQINLLFDTILASFLIAGSVSWLYYSDRLVEFPLGLFGVALGTVILPTLSRHHAEATPEAFSHTLDWALRWLFLIGTPAMIALMVLAEPLLITLFYYGEFDSHSVTMTALSLRAYSVGLLGFMLVKVLAPGFYARQDTRTPVRYGVISMGANMGLNLLFVVPLVWWQVEGTHAGLALATSLAAYLNAFLLGRYLYREQIYRPQLGWGHFARRLLLANLLLALGLLWGVPAAEAWMSWPFEQRLAMMVLVVVVGMVGYLGLLWGLRLSLKQLLRYQIN